MSSTQYSDDVLPGYEKPSIALAKEFLETALPHRILDSTQRTGYRLANDGEVTDPTTGEKTPLYDLWSTPGDAMDEFGIGVSLYFKTLKGLFVVMFFCAFINLVAVYQNKEDNPNQSDIDQINALYGLDLLATPSNLIGSTYGAKRDLLKFSKQCACDIAVCIVLGIFSIFAAKAEETVVETIDLKQQTTQDYAVEIKNPPASITDPKDYHSFFSRFGDVVSVTVAKKNGNLLKKFAERECLAEQLDRLEKKEAIDRFNNVPVLEQHSLSSWQRALQPYGFYYTTDFLKESMKKTEEDIRALSAVEYAPWRVYAVYNKEAMQRDCLAKTSVGHVELWRGSTANKDAVLNGFILQVDEAPEPSDIIYENSNYSNAEVYLSWAASVGVASCILVAAGFIIQSITDASASSGSGVQVAIFISLLNASLPEMMKLLTTSVEIHDQAGDVQESILFKLVVTRCIGSAVLLYLTTPFERQFSDEYIGSIQNILIADAILSPLIRLFDPTTILYRYVLSPNAPTQSDMNSYWRPMEWNLSERYTDLIKSLFVGLYFAVPLPTGLFIVAFSILSTYLVDKFSLFRLWRKAPMMDSSLSVVSRYFFIATVWVHLTSSRLFFAGWPFRGLLAGTQAEDTGEQPNCGFFYCHTNSSMTDEQQRVVRFYNVVCIVVFCLVIINIFVMNIVQKVVDLFYTVDKVVGEASEFPFRSLDAPLYIPKVVRELLFDPVVCADLCDLPEMYVPDTIDQTDDKSDKNVLSVAKVEYLDFIAPNISQDIIKKLFSEVVFYEQLSWGAQAGLQPQQPIGLQQAAAYPYPNNAFPSAPAPIPNPFQNPNPQHQNAHNSLSATISQTHRSLHMKNSSHAMATSKGAHGESLPAGWDMRYTPTGKPYYVNHITRTTQWTPPEPEGKVEHASRSSKSVSRKQPIKPVQPQSQAASVVNTSTVGSVAAPVSIQPQLQAAPAPVVMLNQPPIAGTVFNQPLAQPVLVSPPGAVIGIQSGYVAPLPNPIPSMYTQNQGFAFNQSNVSANTTRPLPEGWEQKLTADGKVYFVDHNNKTTHWNLP